MLQVAFGFCGRVSIFEMLALPVGMDCTRWNSMSTYGFQLYCGVRDIDMFASVAKDSCLNAWPGIRFLKVRLGCTKSNLQTIFAVMFDTKTGRLESR